MGVRARFAAYVYKKSATGFPGALIFHCRLALEAASFYTDILNLFIDFADRGEQLLSLRHPFHPDG